MPSAVQQQIADYLRGQQKEPNAGNISRAIAAASINPGLIPGLSVGGTGEYSPGDPRTGGLQPGNVPNGYGNVPMYQEPDVAPLARRSVSAPTRPRAPSAPRPPGASNAPIGGDVDLLGNKIVAGLPPTGTPRDKNEMGGSVPQGPAQQQQQQQQQQQPTRAPAPNVVAQQPDAGGLTDTSAPEGSYFPPKNAPTITREQAIARDPRGLEYTPGFLPGMARMASDLYGSVGNPSAFLTELTRPRFAAEDMQAGVDVAGLGTGLAGGLAGAARALTPWALRQLIMGEAPTAPLAPSTPPPRGSVVPNTQTPPNTNPWGIPPTGTPRQPNVLGTGGSVPRSGPVPPPFTAGTPTPTINPFTGKPITPAAPVVPQSAPTVPGPAPGMTATSPTVTNSPVAQLVARQLSPQAAPAPTSTLPAVSPSVMAQLQAAIARSQGASAQRAAGPSPIAQLIEEELARRAAAVGSGQPAVMPAPNMPGIPPSTPPPVHVPAPTAQPIPTPASTTVPLPLLEELEQVGKSRPVVVPESAQPRNITIEQGKPPDVQAVPRRGAGPRKELTSGDVPKEMTVRESMAKRLEARRAQERRGLRDGG